MLMQIIFFDIMQTSLSKMSDEITFDRELKNQDKKWQQYTEFFVRIMWIRQWKHKKSAFSETFSVFKHWHLW